MDLNLDVRRQSDHVVVEVGGEVDLHTAPQLGDALGELIENGDHRIVLDLGGVDFLDSTGLGVLVGAFKKTGDRGGWLRVVCAEERILKIFRITGLDKQMELFATQSEAVAGN